MTESGNRAAEEQPIYTGMRGQTRRDRVHVPTADGQWQSQGLLVSVNVATDPGLRDAALTLTLHAHEGLAVCYTLHDPARRKFCLVVPEALVHRAIDERIALLQGLAADGVPVPPYVWDLKTVVGVQELAAYWRDESPRSQYVAQQEAMLQQHAEMLASEEIKLRSRVAMLMERERATELEQLATQQEREALLATREELDALRSDLELREQELEARLDMLRAREIELLGRSSSLEEETAQFADESGVFHDGGTNVVRYSELESLGASTAADDLEAEAALDDADVESELDDDEFEEEIDDEVEQEIDDEVEEEIDDEIEALDGDSSEVELPTMRQSTIGTPTVVPPAGFLHDPDLEMVALTGDMPRLFAKLDANKASAFSDGAELLAQLSVVQGYPVVLLALVESNADRPYVRRAVLDPRSPDARELLDHLRTEFRARVALYSAEGRYARTLEVGGPREQNVAAILERVDQLKDFSIDAQTACERALAVPPPVRDAHPFGEVDLSNARAVVSAIAQAAVWASDERRERAIFALSVPVAQIDRAFKSVGSAALRFGLAMPSSLRSRVVSLGLASDVPALLTKQCVAFRALAKRDDRGGLSVKEIAANWEALLAEAAEHDFALDAETHADAWEVLRTVRGDTRTRAALPTDVDLASLPDLGAPQLVMLLDHPKVRKHAAIELCRRADANYAKTLMDALRRMPRGDVAFVAPHLARFGEGIGDALIDGLGARKTFVRHASALVLSHLKLRRAITPLVGLLATEESDVWKDLARVIGETGTASVRPLAKLAKERKTAASRVALALAHASLHGARKQVQQLEKDDPSLAGVLTEASDLEDEARIYGEQAHGKRALATADSVLELSRKFYEELTSLALTSTNETSP